MSTDIPRMRYNTIKAKADEVRANYNITGVNFDIYEFIEYDLKLEVRPVPDLSVYLDTGALISSSDDSSSITSLESEDSDIEAFITNDLTTIFVDQRQYDGDSQSRLRFSIAHEIGHFFLHKKIILDNQPNYRSFFNNLSDEEYDMIERQANEFAGRLLVPKDLLVEEVSRYVNIMEKFTEGSVEITAQGKSHLCKYISEIFNVSPKVIEIRLDKEGLWKEGLSI